MKKVSLILVILLIIFHSCSRISPDINVEQNKYTISIEDATQVLMSTLADFQNQTKSSQLEICSIETVCGDDLNIQGTKSTNLGIDNLLYIFNFTNNNGFAIVAADNRISDPVLMIADIGNISKDIFKTICESSFIYNLIGDYVVYSIDLPSDDETDFDDSEGGNGGNNGGNNGGAISNVPPMLQTAMHQGLPYNYFCPAVENDTLAPAGCIPIAMAQIFNYYQYPHINDNLNIPFASNYILDYSISGIPRLIENIGLRTDIEYDKDGSGTTMAKAKTAMEEYYAYEDVTKYNLYRENIILDMISEHKPVLIGASNQWIGGKGHAWVIDGYMYSSTAGHLLHCNMGWGGPGNGYYVSGVFDVTSGTAPYYPDNTTDANPNDENKDYAYHYRFLDYNRPR